MELTSYFGKAIDNPTVCREKSLTRQSEAAACDINVIMKQYERSGQLPLRNREAVFADVSEIGDFRTAVETIERGRSVFMQLPAEVRERFGNDAAGFLDWVNMDATIDQLREIGLVEAAPAVEPPAEAPPAS